MPKRTHIAVIAVALLVSSGSSAASAQQPKLDIKVLAGFTATFYDFLSEVEPSKEVYGGWLAGFGARFSRRKAFGELQLTFNRVALRLNPDEALARINSFQIPINLGYIPYKVSKFGVYLYGGYVNHFNVAIQQGSGRGRTRVGIRGTGFAIYQALVRFGVSFDLYMFNFDFNYSIGLNSATVTPYRTRYQAIQLNLAYLF